MSQAEFCSRSLNGGEITNDQTFLNEEDSIDIHEICERRAGCRGLRAIVWAKDQKTERAAIQQSNGGISILRRERAQFLLILPIERPQGADTGPDVLQNHFARGLWASGSRRASSD